MIYRTPAAAIARRRFRRKNRAAAAQLVADQHSRQLAASAARLEEIDRRRGERHERITAKRTSPIKPEFV